MKYFFSCDWGTSAFRLRLIEPDGLKVLSEIKTNNGIAVSFDLWKTSGGDESNRVWFYQSYLFARLKEMKAAIDDTLHEAPVILSGMASSSIGMMELPYKEIPFRCDGSDLVLQTITAGEEHPGKMIIISGARSEVDAVRGEETMLAGCDAVKDGREKLFIFPGTHSKHMLVEKGLVTNITTYITGELFDLLSNKSILSASVKKRGEEAVEDDHFFIEGVIKGSISNLSNSVFQVRTNQLFNKLTPQENYDFLSGLLIGYELKEVAKSKTAAIVLVCGEGLKNAYTRALGALGLSEKLVYQNADDALIKGQWRIIRHAL